MRVRLKMLYFYYESQDLIQINGFKISTRFLQTFIDL